MNVPMPAPAPSAPKLQYVDALRGIAILLVILVHTGGRTPEDLAFASVSVYGQYGVQLFFVMSAFTLCHSMDRMHSLTKPGYLSFMSRRFFRIAPLYYIGIVFYFCFAWVSLRFAGQIPFTEPDEYSMAGVVTNILLIHGLVPEGNSNVVPGGWSIGCEFLFYAAFPFIFMHVRKNRRALVYYVIPAFLIAILIHLWAVRTPGMETGMNAFPYFSVFNQFPCFALGILYYQHRSENGFRKVFICSLLPALVAIVWVHHQDNGWFLTPALAGIASVGLALILEKASIPYLLGKIGQLSYSMYLWHFVVVWIIGYFFKRMLPHGDLISLLQYFVIVAITTAIAEISSQLIERPGIAIGSTVATSLGRARCSAE
jgi:peptidoglycan/LPS O-acetylase OafA/YrhL